MLGVQYGVALLQKITVDVTDMSSRFWSSLRLALVHIVFGSTLLTLTVAQDSPISTPSGVYNSSKTPESFAWNTYNYCNAPHVVADHYEFPTNVSDAKLVYANMMIRHHKVCAHGSQI